MTTIAVSQLGPIKPLRLARTLRGFLDAGAHTGLYTLPACQTNPWLHAVAVELYPVGPDAAQQSRRQRFWTEGCMSPPRRSRRGRAGHV